MRKILIILGRCLLVTLFSKQQMLFASNLEFKIPANSMFVRENVLEITMPQQNTVRFCDIIGQTKIKQTLNRAVNTLQGKQSTPLKSILIKGESGCGKTLFAKALAGEAGALMLRVRVSEELLFGQKEVELSFGIKNKLELIVTKARELATTIDCGIVIFIDNLDTALNDYILSQVIKDISPSNSYSCIRARFRNSLVKAIEKIEESDDRIVIVACANQTKNWDKPYPRDFEPIIESKLEEKFKEIINVPNLSSEDIIDMLNKQITSQSMFLEADFDKQEFAKKLQTLSPKLLENFISEATNKSTQGGRLNVKMTDFDFTRIEEQIAASMSTSSSKEKSKLGTGCKVFPQDQITENFENVVVPPELNADFNLIVDCIKHAPKFAALKANPPRGILLFGEAGTGKTTLVKAIAGQSKANLIKINCNTFSDNFSEVFFYAQQLTGQTVILIDEIDSLCEKYLFSSIPASIKTLIEDLDALRTNNKNNITIIATAKNCNLGTPSLFRPGRFEKMLEIGVPCTQSLVRLLQDYIDKNNMLIDPNLALSNVARGAMGMSRSQLFDMINRAAIQATVKNKTQIQLDDFEFARAAVMADGEIIKNIKTDDSAGSSVRGDDKFFQSPGKFYPPSSVQSTFKDVAGCNQAKEQLQEIVNYLTDPQKFKKCGAKIPAGILMIGEPGTGKTLLARAVAGEAGCPFISVSASKFDDMYVGVGKNRVEALFKQARRYSPCLIFIDEIDAVGRRREADRSRGCDQTINQLLAEMDGFEKSDKAVVIIAATNRADTLDSAIKRSGRFDRKVIVELPNVEAREQILAVHGKKINLDEHVNLELLAKATVGFSGADLATMINEAALKSNREHREQVTHADLEWARDFVFMGGENRFLMKSKENVKKTAYHEAGHALVRLLEPEANPLHKLTIIPRGNALGITWSMPDEENSKSSKAHYLAEIRTAMGGRAAEELMFGAAFSGVVSDLEKATSIATLMVKKFGMSSLGPIFLDSSTGTHESEKTREFIDTEIQTILREAYAQALQMLTENKKRLITLAETLIEKETLSEEEARKLLNL